jgi:hypothetical protein
MRQMPTPTPLRLALASLTIAAVALVAGGCQRPDASSARAGSAGPPASAEDGSRRPRPGYAVDSVLPPEEALRRFRAGLTPVARLAGGATSRDRLVAAFVRAVETRDTSALRGLEMSKAEFAYLLYPSSIYTRPPFQQQPEIVWMLQRANGGAGYRRLVERYAGRPLGYRGHRCDGEPEVRGENRIWGGCTLGYQRARGDTATGRLFGAILEREGRFKFVSYANDL